MNLKKIIREEIGDLDWIQKSEPDRKDIISFNKERYKTTLNYDNAEIGDKFIPPGSHMVWTVDDKEFWRGKWGNDENGDPEYYRYFVIWIKNERGDIKRKYYNETTKLFPGTYRPWRKIVGSNVNESEEFDWAKEINPEMTAEAVPLYYNKPLFWYHRGEPRQCWGMPVIYWLSESHISQRGENTSLLCYNDGCDRESKIECSEFYNRTIASMFNQGTLRFQPQLSDIEED